MPTYYHVTPISHLKKIMADGLVPTIGPRSKKLHEPMPAVYLFSSIDAVDEALFNWLEDAFAEDARLALLSVQFEHALGENPEFTCEIIFADKIAPNQITIVSRDLLEESNLRFLIGSCAEVVDDSVLDRPGL